MADDYQDIGSGIEVFPITPNWTAGPTVAMTISRDLRKHPGTQTEINQVTDFVPFRADAQFMCENHERLYELIDFFVGRKARVERFWLRVPMTGFTLKEDAISGAASLVCEPNVANLAFLGHERIYLRYKASEDTMSRKVNSVTYDDIDDDVTLVLNTVLDRDTNVADVVEFGRLILCRFDIDTLTLKFPADGFGTMRLQFYEVIQEYSEI